MSSVEFCRNMSSNVELCRISSYFVELCRIMSNFVDSCRILSKNVVHSKGGGGLVNMSCQTNVFSVGHFDF